ncbi:MAG: hypothetical protein J6J62_01890 [Oscillospiraceae bacterium]|nr:hypothetical protein [Oscillospiraceae bacterium]
MPIKNYTTKVDIFTSLGEIQSALARAGANKIMVDYDGGVPVAVTFSICTPQGARGFALPAPVEGTLRVFAKQKVKADRRQAEMTAWRNVRDWVLAQMALVESCDVPTEQVFLPYMINGKGQTLFEVYSSGQLMLEGGL